MMTKKELKERQKQLHLEYKELMEEYKRITAEGDAINEVCKSLNTGTAISELLVITEEEYTPELFKKAQTLLRFFRRHRRHSEDSHVYAVRLRKYEVALAELNAERERLKEA